MKENIKKLLKYLPDEGKSIRGLYHNFKAKKQYLFIKIKMLSQEYNIPHPDKIYWIDTDRIVFHTDYGSNDEVKHNVFDMKKDKGAVYGGDWDKSDFKFTDLKAYKAIEDRIKNNVLWEDTEFYREILERINAGETPWSCKSKKDLDEHFQYLDELIESIKEKGYRNNKDINTKDQAYKDNREITVNIGRDGEFLFQDGRHRLAIAKVFGIERIPVQVLVRHKRWQEFRQKVFRIAKGKGGSTKKDGYLYQPLLHPDLQDIPAIHDCKDRFEAIKEDLPLEEGKVLDIGANFGYFTHKFEDIGFDCVAVEYNNENVEIAKKIKKAENKNFEFIHGDILDNKTISYLKNYQFDVILALNIFHHFLKEKERYDKLKILLNELNFKIMYFEPHLPDEKQMADAYKDYAEDEFVDFILSQTNLENKKLVYQAKDGRKIFRLY